MTNQTLSADETGQPTAALDVLFGKQTELGVANFGGGRRRVADVPPLIRNYARVKRAAAVANEQLGVVAPTFTAAIQEATDEVIAGSWDDQFPTALVLGGGGTTTNMNFNEVLAARASRIAGATIHPNDHVNASQSTNDTYPTAMALTVLETADAPIDALERLTQAFQAKADEYADVRRLGRTCLQDAVTLTVGETHGAHVSALTRAVKGLRAALDGLRSVPLGATVLGTGIGAPEGYREIAVAELSTLVGRELEPADDLFDSLAHLDVYTEVSQAASRTATTLAKIAADLRLLASGPNGGLAEVRLPVVQAGSSIMPGKVNPVVPEYVMQLSYRVRGAAHTVEAAVAAGELELNVMEPIIIDALLDIFEDLASSATVFAEKCVHGLEWTGTRREANAAAAYDRWVELAAREGYDAATAAVRAHQVELEQEVR